MSLEQARRAFKYGLELNAQLVAERIQDRDRLAEKERQLNSVVASLVVQQSEAEEDAWEHKLCRAKNEEQKEQLESCFAQLDFAHSPEDAQLLAAEEKDSRQHELKVGNFNHVKYDGDSRFKLSVRYLLHTEGPSWTVRLSNLNIHPNSCLQPNAIAISRCLASGKRVSSGKGFRPLISRCGSACVSHFGSITDQ